jgi:hypothetical protein
MRLLLIIIFVMTTAELSLACSNHPKKQGSREVETEESAVNNAVPALETSNSTPASFSQIPSANDRNPTEKMEETIDIRRLGQ